MGGDAVTLERVLWELAEAAAIAVWAWLVLSPWLAMLPPPQALGWR